MSQPLGPVLAIDDNAAMLATMTRALSRWRRVIPCRTSAEALRAVEPWGHLPSAVVADVSLGGWPDGVELVRQVRERAGPIPALLMTGHAMLPTDTIERLAALRPSVRFATKIAMRTRIADLMELIACVDPAVNTDTTELARAIRDLSQRVALSAVERRLLAVAIHGAKRDELAARLGTNVNKLVLAVLATLTLAAVSSRDASAQAAQNYWSQTGAQCVVDDNAHATTQNAILYGVNLSYNQ